MDYFIIALGNKGDKYRASRHNAGWIVLDYIYDGDWEENKYAKSLVSGTTIGDKDLLFIKPLTFMNKSGEVTEFLKKEYSLSPEQIIVLHDDIDLPLGKFKISFDRGDGGHNGLKSIMNHLNSKQFIRLRIGISKDIGGGMVEKPAVLGSFTVGELTTLEQVSKEVQKAIETLALHGLEKAMARFN